MGEWGEETCKVGEESEYSIRIDSLNLVAYYLMYNFKILYKGGWLSSWDIDATTKMLTNRFNTDMKYIHVRIK